MDPNLLGILMSNTCQFLSFLPSILWSNAEITNSHDGGPTRFLTTDMTALDHTKYSNSIGIVTCKHMIDIEISGVFLTVESYISIHNTHPLGQLIEFQYFSIRSFLHHFTSTLFEESSELSNPISMENNTTSRLNTVSRLLGLYNCTRELRDPFVSRPQTSITCHTCHMLLYV